MKIPTRSSLKIVIAIKLLLQTPSTAICANKDSDERYTGLETFAKAMYYLETMYVDPDRVKSSDMIENALKGIVSNLDPHTILMPRKAFEQLTLDTKGRFGGVGIIVSQERGRLIIVSPIENTPASKKGIKSGDQIVKIDDISISDMKGNESVERMRGVPGSILKLTIKRKDEPSLLKFELRREIIKIKSVREYPLTNDIHYVRISSFQEETSKELKEILKKRKNKIKGLVLDLRDNPGGLLDQSVKVVDLFVESGLIVSTVGRDPDRIEREFAQKSGTYSDFPMIVLINDGSASASEIVAGALQDHQRALVMGLQSFGKGSVQTLVTLPDGSGLKLTVARYYTPKDRSIQAKGIKPDIIIEKKQVSKSNTKKKGKKESDLKGHISGDDLSDLSVDSSMLSAIKKWPDKMKEDVQLLSAFTYLKGWSIFKN